MIKADFPDYVDFNLFLGRMWKMALFQIFPKIYLTIKKHVRTGTHWEQTTVIQIPNALNVLSQPYLYFYRNKPMSKNFPLFHDSSYKKKRNNERRGSEE